jgi:Zn-dependent peptidase ImmA (M78 family)
VPVHDLAERLGFAVRVCALPAGVDGRLRVTDGDRLIELAAGQARVRHRFSLAHEVGHDRLGHHQDGSYETPLAELQADLFAGALLVPAAWLRRDVATHRTIPALVERYQVSREVMFIALKEARLLGRVRV